MGILGWSMAIPGRAGHRRGAREVTGTCLLAAFLFSACSQATAQPVSTPTHGSLSMTSSKSNNTPTIPTSISVSTVLSTSTFLKPFNCLDPEESVYSPNGDWVAQGCYNSENLDIYTNKASDLRLSFQLFFSGIFNSETVGRLKPYYWSNDSRYLYLLASKLPDSDHGICWIPFGFKGLLKLDIMNRSIDFIVGSEIGNGDYVILASPNKRQIIYSEIGKHPATIELVNDPKTIKTSISVDQEDTVVTQFLWSPDGTRVAVEMTNCPDSHKPSSTFGIISLDINPPLLKPFFYYQTGVNDFSLFNWMENDTIVLEHAGLNDIYDDYDVKKNKFIDNWLLDYIFLP